MIHNLSFDIEDIYQSFKERGILGWEKDVDGETHRILRILDMLDFHRQTATFFILTDILPDYTDLILEIQRRGHEIASHGHEHRRLSRVSATELKNDLLRSKALLEDLINDSV